MRSPRTIESPRTAFLALVATATLAGCAAQSPSRRPIGGALALETFDAAHRCVAESHFDTTFNGVDWPALGAELRPRAAAARTTGELRGVVRTMLERLRQSHFSLIPRESAAPDAADTTAIARAGTLGLEARYAGDRMVVTHVEPGGAAESAGIRPGWIVESAGGTPVRELIARERRRESIYGIDFRVASRLQSRLDGPAGSTCRLVVRDGRDRRVRLAAPRLRPAGEPVRLGNLPAFFARAERRRLDAPGGPSIGVLSFNIWMVPLMRDLDSAIDEFRDLDGIVIDLRGNRGGVGAMVAGLAGHFVGTERSLGVMRTRELELNVLAMPRRVNRRSEPVDPFAGPVAILTDCMTGSASEVFTGGMRSIGRVRVFGDTTVGGVLPALMDRLPNDDVLFHAFGEFVTADGTHLEGRGVVPDVFVPVDRAALLAGRDLALDEAVRWIATVPRAAAIPVVPRPEQPSHTHEEHSR